MGKGLFNWKKLFIIILAIIACVSFIILPGHSNFLNCGSYAIKSKSLTIEQLAIESVRVRYIGSDKNILGKIFTLDFIKKLDEDEMSFFYTNKIFYDIDGVSPSNEVELNQNSNTLSVRVYDSSGTYIQVLTLEKISDDNYLVSNVQIDI